MLVKEAPGNMEIDMHFLSFLNIEVAQVVEIHPHGKQGPVYHMW